MIPDIAIPEDKQFEFIIASLIRQEAMMMNISENVNTILALAQKQDLQKRLDESDGEYLVK